MENSLVRVLPAGLFNKNSATRCQQFTSVIMSPEDASCTTSPLIGTEVDHISNISPIESTSLRCIAELDTESRSSSKEISDDVQKFDGTIVYNPDGSAYIFEICDEDANDVKTSLEAIPKLDGCIVEDTRRNNNFSSDCSYPAIANAFYVKNKKSYNSSHIGNLMSENVSEKETKLPVVYSYRVFSLRDDINEEELRTNPSSMPGELLNASHGCVPIKPILMCFVCKLSFGHINPFILHAKNDHQLKLNHKEIELLEHKNISAIIQCVGTSKEMLISFLEPVLSTADTNNFPLRALNNLFNTYSTSVSYLNSVGSAKTSSLSRKWFDASESANVICEQSLPTVPTLVPISQVSPIKSYCLNPSDNSDSDYSDTESIVSCHQNANQLDNSKKDLSDCEGLDLSFKSGIVSSLSSQHHGDAIQSVVKKSSGVIKSKSESISESNIAKQEMEPSNCDFLSSSQQLSNQMSFQMSSRNSCKTLKCPKCNWHYKYQETLDIHMKEKHPDSDTSCTYCLTNQAHPRLARGESYTCGYKPYRCEVCNYSTTTKGNLSIHMQSDKHLNNMQELQSGNVENDGTFVAIPENPLMQMSSSSPTSPAMQKTKPKATWRCDVCNYETNVARNLRIHMTSEKHTHNMMMLQQNIKQFHHLSSHQNLTRSGNMESSPIMSCVSGLNFSTENSQTSSESALADVAYNQAVLFQMMASNQSPASKAVDKALQNIEDFNSGNDITNAEGLDNVEPNPKCIFQCCICCVFAVNSIESMNVHLNQDRTKVKENQVLALVSGNYICKLCSYKTNLKANFQLHCKTDKHLQRLQHINHIKEGGPQNEWRLKYMNMSNPVQVRCNACDFYTNNCHKLQIHAASRQHEIALALFWHLNSLVSNLLPESFVYLCVLCDCVCTSKMSIIKHAHSMKHLQTETLHQLKKNAEVKDVIQSIPDIFRIKLHETAETSNRKFENSLKLDEYSKYGSCINEDAEKIITPKHENPVLLCPLCQNVYENSFSLEQHVIQQHNVSSEGMNRLLLLVENSSVTCNVDDKRKKSVLKSNINLGKVLKQREEDSKEETETKDIYTCSVCYQEFLRVDELRIHQEISGHSYYQNNKNGLLHVCWKKDCNKSFLNVECLQQHFRDHHMKNLETSTLEKHSGKHKCNQCNLGFETFEKLQIHSHYHSIRNALKCEFCCKVFCSISDLNNHLDSHSEVPNSEVLQHKVVISSNAALWSDKGNQSLGQIEFGQNEENDGLSTEYDKQEQEVDNSSDESKELHQIEDYLSSPNLEDTYNDPTRKFKCHRCRVAFTRQSYLSSHNKTLLHRKGEKLSYPLEKYLDPNRPFKCEICKESFTQKNILLVHYNSVSHLHKLKRSLQEQHQHNINFYASLSMKDEEDKKKYKCNLCKVSYSQLEALDMHMMSVMHQSRASESQVLTPTEHFDPSKYASEQYGSHKIENLSNESRGVSNVIETYATDSETDELQNEDNSESQNISEVKIASDPHIHEADCRNSSTSPSKSADLNCHDQKTYTFNATISSNSLENIGNKKFEKFQAMGELQDDYSQKIQLAENDANVFPISLRKSSYVYKYLLESYGFDLVMQFNELYQKSSQKEELSNSEFQETTSEYFPELRKSECDICNRIFSSIWVLKAHKEEAHSLNIPVDIINAFAEMFKQQFEKKVDSLKNMDHISMRKDIPFGELIKYNSNFGETLKTLESSFNLEKVNNTKNNNASSRTGDQIEPISSEFSTSENMSTSILQQMDEMNAALNAMAVSQMQQLQYNPMMFGLAGIGMNYPYACSMQAMAAMNLQPPLMPFLVPPPLGLDPLTAAAFVHAQSNGVIQSSGESKFPSQKSNANQQKRARTRISDEQLKILRAHFDINNSPTEDQISAMAQKSGLPSKVIKHWFRNTLFKERQRNKDSPYNFSNPPCTSLNLDDYNHRKIEGSSVTKRSTEDFSEFSENDKRNSRNNSPECHKNQDYGDEISSQRNEDDSVTDETNDVKSSICEETDVQSKIPSSDASVNAAQSTGTTSSNWNESVANMQNQSPLPGYCLYPFLPTSLYDTSLANSPMNKKFSQKFNNFVASGAPSHSISPNSTKSDSFIPFISCSSNSSGKRANRTRFTDHQIKILQEFFENNAYPKDDDLEYLSKLLGLSPRVIVVWFQNARQKARKIYENQPSVEGSEENPGRFSRTPGLNYQCKKCMLVFQRYYELIRHQKNQCYKNEDSHPSVLNTSGSAATPSSCQSPQLQNNQTSQAVSLSFSEDSNSTSNNEDTNYSIQMSPSQCLQGGNYRCEACALPFPSFDAWRDHQLIHIINCNLFANVNCASDDSQAKSLEKTEIQAAGKKRFVSEEDDKDDQPKDKRLRTTILPEQLEVLYQKYQAESNPSRKMLESIASEIGLTKRVVQVWFQNTRARERKGQFRVHNQVINKRCPFCPALFKVKSALESHLMCRHSEQYARGDVNIDCLPDESDCDSEACASRDRVGACPTGAFSNLLQSCTSGAHIFSKGPEQRREYYKHSSVDKREYGGTEDANFPLDLSRSFKSSCESSNAEEAGCRNFPVSEHSSNSDVDREDFFDSNPTSPDSSSDSRRNAVSARKRFRTQITNQQIQIMKRIFDECKTPTMLECDVLGREIRLPKRVIQVWFQNARAKDKKYKSAMLTSSTEESSREAKFPDECALCKVKYSLKDPMQDHLFSRQHIENIRSSLQEGANVKSESPSKSRPMQFLHDSRYDALLTASYENDKNNVQFHLSNGMSSAATSASVNMSEAENLFMQMYGLPFPGYRDFQQSGSTLLQAMYTGQASMYENSFGQGIPLSMIQLPLNVAVEVYNSLEKAGTTTIRFSQDGRKLSPKSSFQHFLTESEHDMGYVCKKCRRVFPLMVFLQAHHKHSCYVTDEELQGQPAILKLVEVHYACLLCNDNFPTLVEFCQHCVSAKHQDLNARFNYGIDNSLNPSSLIQQEEQENEG